MRSEDLHSKGRHQHHARAIAVRVFSRNPAQADGSAGLAAYVYSYSSVGFCYQCSREGPKNRFGRRIFEREDLFGPRNHLSERELLIAEGDE